MLNMISYDNITLVPRVISEVVSRDDVDTSVDMGSFTLDVPIIASPMPDVCGADSAFILRRCGSMGIIHRFQTVKGQLTEFCNANSVPETSSASPTLPKIRNYDSRKPVACAIGINGDYLERFQTLWTAGCRVFCLDTANGANKQVKTAVLAIRDEWKTYANAEYCSPYIIAGNVATKEGYEFLAELGVNAVRVGMAGGSVCTTRNETGVFMPTLESVDECVQYRKKYHLPNYISNRINMPLIIADGGIRYPGDMAKAIAVGADVVMGGRIFAGYKESPGSIVKDRTSNGLYKLYRGAASHGVQKSTSGEQPDYNEGAEELVPYIDKSVASVVSRFRNGLRSTMSMMNATTISAFRDNVSIEDL